MMPPRLAGKTLAATLRPFEESARQMTGWRFEYLPDVIGGDAPWDYDGLASQMAQQAATVIDLGTGGGETFSTILSSANCAAYATEEWGPNVAVAAQRLQGLAPVTHCCSLQLPFADNAFDLVLARHEAINPAEVARVLAPGGCFFSQQVIHNFMFELRDYFPGYVIFPDFFRDYQAGFLQSGLQIVRAEAFRHTIRFKELGHLVYQLIVAPWTVPGFSIDTHLEGLMRLNDKVQAGADLDFTGGYYLLQVQDGK